MIAGAGFARMAWELAWSRKLPVFGGYWRDHLPVERANLYKHSLASAEYYRIIDSATASWPAFAGERQFMTPRVGL